MIRIASSAALVAALIVSSSNPAHAGPCDQYRGASAFPAMSPRFPCDELLRMDDRACKPAMAVLWQYFGDDPTCVARFAARYSDRPHLLEFHLSDEACRKSHSCFWPRSYLPGFSEGQLSKALEAMEPLTRQGVHDRTLEIKALADQIRTPLTELALSVGLEESLSSRARANLVAAIREVWPEVAVVTFGGGGDIREYHSPSGSTKLACIANEDGLKTKKASTTAKFFKHYARCRAVFAFREEWQGRTGNFHKLDPKDRNFSISGRDVKDLGDVLAR